MTSHIKSRVICSIPFHLNENTTIFKKIKIKNKINTAYSTQFISFLYWLLFASFLSLNKIHAKDVDNHTKDAANYASNTEYFFIVIYKNSNYLMAQRGNESNFMQVNEPVNQDNVLHILYNSR